MPSNNLQKEKFRKIDPGIFNPTMTAAVMKPAIFAQAIIWAKQFSAQPDNMALRKEIKHFCDSNSLPYPNFPAGGEELSEQVIFTPLHIAIENPYFADFLVENKISWVKENNINSYHINCNCRAEAGIIPLSSAGIINIIAQTISCRGQLFYYMPRLNRCCKAKIDPSLAKLIIEVGFQEFVEVKI